MTNKDVSIKEVLAAMLKTDGKIDVDKVAEVLELEVSKRAEAVINAKTVKPEQSAKIDVFNELKNELNTLKTKFDELKTNTENSNIVATKMSQETAKTTEKVAPETQKVIDYVL